VGGGGVLIVVSRCVATSSLVARLTPVSEHRSRVTQKLRDLRRWECYQEATGEDTAG
jgi:hypothetical protein